MIPRVLRLSSVPSARLLLLIIKYLGREGASDTPSHRSSLQPSTRCLLPGFVLVSPTPTTGEEEGGREWDVPGGRRGHQRQDPLLSFVCRLAPISDLILSDLKPLAFSRVCPPKAVTHER